MDGYSVFVVKGSSLPPFGFPDDMSTGIGHWWKASELKDATSGRPGGGGGGNTSVQNYWSSLGVGRSLGGGNGGSGTGRTPPTPTTTAPSSLSSSLPDWAREAAGGDEELARALYLSTQDK